MLSPLWLMLLLVPVQPVREALPELGLTFERPNALKVMPSNDPHTVMHLVAPDAPARDRGMGSPLEVTWKVFPRATYTPERQEGSVVRHRSLHLAAGAAASTRYRLSLSEGEEGDLEVIELVEGDRTLVLELRHALLDCSGAAPAWSRRCREDMRAYRASATEGRALILRSLRVGPAGSLAAPQSPSAK